jgi:hypothetical protein
MQFPGIPSLPRGIVLAAALTLAACGASEAPSAPGRAGLIVGLPDGSFSATCVRFEGETTGYELLRSSGIQASVDAANPMGPLVCAIAGQGCEFPADDCLCQCRASGGCSYWAYFNWGEDGWRYSHLGAGMRRVHDGDLDAWIWLDRSLPGEDLPMPPAELTLEAICG